MTPARALGTMVAVSALVAGVAIPAYAATQSPAASAEASTWDEASNDSQAFSSSGDLASADLASTSYAARTADEIAQIDAEREALERAKEQQAAQQEAAAQQQQQQEQPAPAQGAPAAAAEPPAPAPEAPPAADGSWVNPLGGAGYYISRSVGSGHEGADMVTSSQADYTVPIYAAKSGTVITSGEVVGGWGNTVAIDHGDGTTTLYGHMSPGSRQVQVGETVTQGQMIGYVGSTGRSTAHHLHIELRINGAIVDPVGNLPI
ncbi:MAG TPA: M23 family metallopeptidase [Candidatus Microbacterium stercoravium]|uniref:M23 family metallopeptidase n=1 Tax=Candidatus Microbacterium stercoravium TaxID=2838697 RepID=A0A9D2H5E6_9MICO|nr:M23 family metallopeptidase [Candidatus Microbacterium stercoravium]